MRFRQGTFAVVLAIALICAASVSAKQAAAPANDNFGSAQSLAGAGGTTSGSNAGATKESGEPNHAGNAGGASIWFTWTAPSSGTATVDTIGSSFDTLLGIYTGSGVSALTTVASNDDISSSNRQSKLSFSAQSGTTYRIAVDGYNKVTGSVTLNWSTVSAPANDAFGAAQSVSGTSGTATGSNVAATKESGEPNHAGNAGGASIWFTWTTPSAGSVTIDTAGSGFDTLLGVYTGSGVSSLTVIASNDDVGGGLKTSKVTFSAQSGTSYRIAVDGYGKATGPVTLNWNLAGSPANDLFAAAQSISGANGTASGSNVAATKESGEPNHAGNAGGASIWFTWTAPSTAPLTVDTSGSSFDTLLAVYTGSSVSALTGITSNDDASKSDKTSKLTFTPKAGTTYRIAVDGYNKFTGSVTLHWNSNSVANDNFAAAQAISGASGTATGATTYATKESGEPNHAGNAGGASIWFTWTAPSTGTATVDTAGSGFDTLLGVYTGTAVSALTKIVANDDAAGSKTSKVVFAAVAGTAYAIAVDGYNGSKGQVTLHGSLVTPTGDPVLAIAGDQHACETSGSVKTAALLGPMNAAVVVPLGDASGDLGLLSEYTGCYDPTWGPFRAISKPAPGNHDYKGDAGAAGYFTYFGAAAGTQGQGWYSYDLGTWHVVVLNSNCSLVGGCGTGSPQVQWLKSDLAAHPTPCTLAYFHHPLFTSSPEPGYNGPVDAIFQALYDGGAAVVVNAHSKSYERFAPQNPEGVADSEHGIREFIAGTGGQTLSASKSPAPNSEAWQTSTLGVLKLTLHAGSYDWQFVPVAGGSYSDSGTGSCHSGKPGAAPKPLVTPPSGVISRGAGSR